MATTRGRAGTADRDASDDEPARKKKTAKKTARKTAARTKKTSGTTRTSAAKQVESLEQRLGELLDGVSSRLAAIEERLPASGASSPSATRQMALPVERPGGSGDLEAVAGRLSQALDEVPRAADFEPLAEHIYELARHAPRLLEALEAVPAAMAPFEQSVASLRETAETLQYVHESFAESLLRLPRAEDYEPLAKPLAEFARVSPALAESLADVLRVTAPLGDSVAGLRRIAEQLSATRDALAGASAPHAASGAADVAALEATAADLRDARAAVDAALTSLPRDPEYKKVANQLREIASVSPSLMDWMQQVTPLSRPLSESVSALREAAERLEAGHTRLLEAIERLEG